jgi:adenylate cyclase
MADEHVLIADDEEDVLDMCARVLSMEGYQVQGVRSGLEAIDMVSQRDFDLLLTDIKMPGISGLQAYRAIKQRNPDIVGVAITGYGSVETAIEALQLGMDDFLLKPFSIDQLSAAVSKALEKKRLERENARLRTLIPLLQLSQASMMLTELDALLREVVQVALRETAASLAVLMLRNEDSEDMEVSAVATSAGESPSANAVRLSDDVVQRLTQGQQPLIWDVTLSHEPFLADHVRNAELSAGVAVPLVVNSEVIGILALMKQHNGTAFTRSDTELLSILAGQAAIAIQNARLFSRTRSAYEKLSTLDHLKSEFISIAAHELRTPLAEIATYLAVLEQEGQADATYLAGIRRAAAQLRQLVNDMTDLRFLEAGQVELQRKELSFPNLLDEVLGELGPLAETKGQSIKTRLPKKPPRICVDASKLRIILKNLISNAIKFTPVGGQITIEARTTAKDLRVAVRDTGPGIPEDEREWIFKPFYQLESSLVRQHEGIGTGLAIAKNLIELHGGRIWVDSTVGQGSTFHINIPDCLRPPANQAAP